ncbi:MAG: GNAT family N-acetyltransferase [Chlorobi bacterium]|nr:GNAT family N-acetyltransferase [Chlorobiota bacterium]MCI0716289.1 GNAT family N-acetyltransferase [Chlorobiota bacterium]
MKAVKVDVNNVADFIAYCRKCAAEQDESNVPEDDYLPREDEPAYLLLESNGDVIGAAAIMLHREYVEAKKARFRIFHCINKSYNNYKALLDEILNQSNGVDFVYCFITEGKSDVRTIWEKLGFTVWRYSWVLERGVHKINRFEFPEGCSVKTLAEGKDERAWCDVNNEAFANMLGHTHLRPEKITEWMKQDSYIAGGMKMLWHNDKPIGTIALIKETVNDESVIFIEGLSILNAYQGRGLGRNLLRYGIDFAKNYGVNKVMLSVNAENESAAKLYFDEGFKKHEIYICYHKTVNQKN